MLVKIRSEKPIIHCITNHVVSNFQANGLLAIGASPIMGEAPEEAAELANIAGALSLNIGTLNEQSLRSMLLAGKSANSKGIPVVLDPVGAGATPFRAAAVNKLLESLDITVLRCNAGELAAIAGADWQPKGVDAGEGEADLISLARDTASKHDLIVALTGQTDIVTDGKEVQEVSYGDVAMTSVTGTGCLLSAVVAAFLAVESEDAVSATVSALRFYGIAGEKASRLSRAPGDFQTAFLNQLALLNQSDINEIAGLKEERL
ncbi:MAG TPA: hydroxyethylthiazole kinase [Planococcus sp. (in: firmicutes)]|nr:hydroxyethylthiazole kinase [Planococcus sp. (in: firmicutes)]